MRRLRCLALLLISLAPLVAGCGGSKQAHRSLVGWAIAGQPLVGATIEAVDASGKVIAKDPEKTLATGAWYLPLDDPPNHFWIVAKGGTDGGAPFTATLKNNVIDYRHNQPRAIVVDLATTFLDYCMQDHSGMTYPQHLERVKTFLGIPTVLDLENSLRATDTWFSGPEFTREAQRYGGVGPFIKKLKHELDAGRTHAFLRPAAPRKARKLQDFSLPDISALQALQGFSGVFSIAGTITGLIRGSAQSAALAQLASAMNVIESDFTELHAEIDAIATEQKKQDYNNAVEPLAKLLERIQVTFPLYQNMLQSRTGSDDQKDAAITAFKNSIDSPGGADWTNTWRGGDTGIGVDGVYAQMVTQGGGPEGALEAWSAYEGTSTTRFISYQTQTLAQEAVNFWLNVQAEVIAVDGAYQSATGYSDPGSTTGTTTTSSTTTSSGVNMDYSQAVSEFSGSKVTDAESSCVASGGDVTSDNFVLNELNASHTCFTQLPDPSSSDDVLVDQATGLMWDYQGFGDTGQAYNALDLQDINSNAWPNNSSDNYTLPTEAQLQTLGSYNVGSWDVTGQYSSPLDMLANYARDHELYALTQRIKYTSPSEPGDYVTTFWSNSKQCQSLGNPRNNPTICFYQTYDLQNGQTPDMLPDTTNNTTVSNANQIGSGLSQYAPYWCNSHSCDAADFFVVRSIGSNEIYGGS